VCGSLLLLGLLFCLFVCLFLLPVFRELPQRCPDCCSCACLTRNRADCGSSGSAAGRALCTSAARSFGRWCGLSRSGKVRRIMPDCCLAELYERD
jgi:hypothetical protein